MTARVYLVRHADAGDRGLWSGRDELRPLTPKGMRQAAALAAALRDPAVERVVTSSAVRCRQTVEPLAAALGLDVTDDDRLFEGEPLGPVLEIILGGGPAVLSTHGDIVSSIAVQVGPAHGIPLDRLRWGKGSTWVLDVRAGTVIGAEYRPPPKV